ncbi:hypothetical protein IX51_06790 [uncultured archaeon]|nr:hypothetical protein IX51_06790 [uncultured archaeon]
MKNLFSELFLSKGVNYFTGDKPLKSILDFFGLGDKLDLAEMGKYVSEELIELLDFIDHSAKPMLHTWSALGERIDYVRLSPDHYNALIELQKMGVIGSMFSPSNSLMQHFLSGYIISDSGIFCTLTLTAQTAYAVDKYADEPIRSKFMKLFLDENNPWFGATFYTETQGGSDLGANLTVASRKDGWYYLSGTDKYFASNAGVADLAVVTARVEGSHEGAKGISVFLVPAYLDDGSQNYRIRRIKDKLGTTAVPTGEVEFENSKAYLLGDSPEGIYIAMEILTISRIDDAIAAVGMARKALWEAVRFADRRTAFGKRVIEQPLMIKDLAEREAELEAALVVSLLSALKFNSAKGRKPPYDDEYQYARLLSSMAKNMASDTSAEITRYAMEIEGGIGFLEEFPMAKFHRDSIVTSIWEGTSNIQALEFLEVLARKNGSQLLFSDLERNIGAIRDSNASEVLNEQLLRLKGRVKQMLSSDNPQFFSKDVLRESGLLLAAVYMFRIGESGTGDSALMLKSAEIFARRHFRPDDPELENLIMLSGLFDWMR